ncbi:MAG: dihydropyrimidinase [Akkermansiaceae bacterium]|jgi:dihydropyrimidinase|nr:dihydropyrimidinase [Akkermansiaceae bacterium]MDP4648069.1 dihydropyrimidinase [Akkermansiaceae bacterium]MDP4721721.1 dihydropyrimidinase [Akkermansiaceae bacterium]MDP4780661.1 dihydropyrimidinase [Akkermansiaceae bacterium]MDP4848457.1 dihydropyrimidinase [Akkermansiaceae bacterium]
MPLLIKNATIVTADETFAGDVLAEDGVIKEIGAGLSAPHAEMIDATGKYLFPGFIDPHVHIYLPFMGTFSKDDYASGSKAALMGGTTTLIEMCCPARCEDPLEAIRLWKSKAAGISSCDYTFHMGVTRFDETTAEALDIIVREEKVTSLKIFLAYKGAFGIEDNELYKTLSFAADRGLVVTAHCENADLVSERQKKLVAEGKTGPEWHEPSRPISVEADGCHHLMTFAEATGAEVYVVHTSCIPAVEAIEAARKRGVKAHIETVAPYLTLDSSYAELPDFEGAKFVMSPPIREKKHGDFLWKKIADGTVDTVGTDHAPFDFETQKRMGHPENALDAGMNPTGKPGNFTLIPNGIPSVEERVKLLYTDGVCEGKIDLQTLVRCASTNAAKIFGLYPRKGAIQIGSDADLVLWDPEYRGEISVKTHSMATDYSAFEGKKVKGCAELVTVRGQVLVRDGEWAGKGGEGCFLVRSVG